nr:uncharacterized protein LOC109778940 isoform X2 [Aegilops tauschii subsp. strangulata]
MGKNQAYKAMQWARLGSSSGASRRRGGRRHAGRFISFSRVARGALGQPQQDPYPHVGRVQEGEESLGRHDCKCRSYASEIRDYKFTCQVDIGGFDQQPISLRQEVHVVRKVCCCNHWTPCPQGKLVSFGGSLHVQSYPNAALKKKSYPNAGSLYRNWLPRVPLQLVASEPLDSLCDDNFRPKNTLWLHSLRKRRGCSYKWKDGVRASLQKRLMRSAFYFPSLLFNKVDFLLDVLLTFLFCIASLFPSLVFFLIYSKLS